MGRSQLSLLSVVILLAGCYQPEIDRLNSELELLQAENAKQRRELAGAREKESKYQGEIDELEEKLRLKQATDSAIKADYQAELKAKEEHLQNLQALYNDLKNADRTEYASLGRLLQEEKWEEAAKGLKAFLEAYPNSELTDKAKRQHTNAVREIRKIEAQNALTRQRQRTALRHEELKKNIESGNLTLEQIKPYLMHKTPDQVRDLLGPPSSTYTGNKWRYSDQVYNPYVGTKTSLKIQFENGLVSQVAYWGQ